MDQYPTTLAEAIDWLSSFGAVNDGGVTRTLYSKSWIDAQQALKGWMEELGLKATYDSIGNLFGRFASNNPLAPTILIGSHIDTVTAGGKFDGAYGILAAIFALQNLKNAYGQPKVNLEVVSLCEEEGSRFPVACWGSGMMTGVYSYEDIKGLRDLDGIEFEKAMKGAGFATGKQGFLVRDDLQSFIELHIEQGPSLEKLNKSIGIVQSIVGQKRFRITIKGESNHAGTTLMKWRKDPLHGAVAMIHELYEMGKEYDEHLVITVGQLIVEPNVSNVIPNQVVFTIDTRHPLEIVLTNFCERFTKALIERAKERDLEITIELWHEAKPVLMDRKLNECVQSICKKEKVSYQFMNSGAGHDSQLFARGCPTALLFVPSQGGISHSPLEYTSTKELETGLHVVTQLLYQLAY